MPKAKKPRTKKLQQRMNKDASVHPSTLAALSKDHNAFQARLPKRKRTQAKPKTTGTLNHIKVRQDVWQKALTLAKGGTSRIEIVANEEVIVHNNPRDGK